MPSSSVQDCITDSGRLASQKKLFPMLLKIRQIPVDAKDMKKRRLDDCQNEVQASNVLVALEHAL
jgi:hypothetical protein